MLSWAALHNSTLYSPFLRVEIRLKRLELLSLGDLILGAKFGLMSVAFSRGDALLASISIRRLKMPALFKSGFERRLRTHIFGLSRDGSTHRAIASPDHPRRSVSFDDVVS
jgi:hypothetical protein